MFKQIPYLLFCCVLFACAKEAPTPETEAGGFVVPQGFPSMGFPENNPYSEASVELGRRLFHDVRLSDDNELSCASCHQSQFAFATQDVMNLGSGATAGTRNSPTLGNIGYHPYFTREGAVPTLEMQILVPIQEHNEFNSNIILIVEELESDDDYQGLSQEAYGQAFSPFVLTRAIANFERTLISGDSKYDRFINGSSSAFNEDEVAGFALFSSDALQCASCHSGFNFSNYEIVNNGLYANYPDPGLARLTGLESDSGKFKVASLRNIALTPPYMHDGTMTSLEEVIGHYASGGAGHQQQDGRIQGFELSALEAEQLVVFLQTLTDYTFSQD